MADYHRDYMRSLPYTSWHAEAGRRYRRGDRQLYCQKCRWVFLEECGCSDRQTSKEFNAMTRQINKEVARKYPSAEKRYRQEVQEALKRGLL